MNLSVSGITGAVMQGLSVLFGLGGISGETGNGLLNFVSFFGMIIDWFVRLFTGLFSAATGK